MKKNTPDFSLEVLAPYVRLTKKESSYTLWVMVPLPMNYHVDLENNPTIRIEEAANLVQVNIDVEGPENNPADEWYTTSLKIALPTPNGDGFGVNEETTIRVSVLVDDPDDTGNVKIIYNQAEEE